MNVRAGLALIVLLCGCAVEPLPAPPSPVISRFSIPAAQLRSGRVFSDPQNRALQSDDAQNPGLLWVEQGDKIFAKDCAKCHAQDEAKRLATKRPRPSRDGMSSENLDDAINHCRTTRAMQTALPAEHQSLLSLSAYLMHLARGETRTFAPQVFASRAWQSGRNAWFEREGRLDLSCSTCHDGLWGKTLLNQTVSQGHSVGFPAYRLEWQGLGSIERRIRACYFGMQAPVPPAGAARLRDLELYLATRSAPLPIEAPAVRR